MSTVRCNRSASSEDHARGAGAIPSRLEFLHGWFSWWVRGYLAKHFHAVRLARASLPRVGPELPILVVLNHPSWWDPLIGVVLSGLFPEHTHFAPMDARALARYRLFGKLGFYGVEQGTRRGSSAFLRTTTAILSRPGSAVWITAQGRFADPRERPPALRPGVGFVARRLSHGVIVPLALEYPFWDERLPEALARFGEPIVVGSGRHRRAGEWLARIEEQLAATQDTLRAESLARDPSAFDTLLDGRVAIGGVYDAWRRWRSARRGERFRAEHGAGGDGP